MKLLEVTLRSWVCAELVRSSSVWRARAPCSTPCSGAGESIARAVAYSSQLVVSQAFERTTGNCVGEIDSILLQACHGADLCRAVSKVMRLRPAYGTEQRLALRSGAMLLALCANGSRSSGGQRANKNE